MLPTDALDPSRLAGAPFLDAHSMDSIERVHGVIIGTRKEDLGGDVGMGWIASIKVSRRSAWLLQDVYPSRDAQTQKAPER